MSWSHLKGSQAPEQRLLSRLPTIETSDPRAEGLPEGDEHLKANARENSRIHAAEL